MRIAITVVALVIASAIPSLAKPAKRHDILNCKDRNHKSVHIAHGHDRYTIGCLDKRTGKCVASGYLQRQPDGTWICREDPS